MCVWRLERGFTAMGLQGKGWGKEAANTRTPADESDERLRAMEARDRSSRMTWEGGREEGERERRG